MKNNEAVKKLVVSVNGFGDVIPSLCVDRATVEECLKFIDRVANPSVISADGCS